MRNIARSGRHSAPRKKSLISTLLTTVAVVTGGVLVALAAAGGTYAMWNKSVATNATAITSGTIGLTVNDLSSYSTDLSMTALLPGRSVVAVTPIVLKNTGVTPMSVTASSISYTTASSTVSPYLIVSLVATTAGSCTVTPDATPLPTTIAPIAFNPGQSRSVCLEVRLASNAPASVQGSTAAFTVNLLGSQVRP